MDISWAIYPSNLCDTVFSFIENLNILEFVFLFPICRVQNNEKLNFNENAKVYRII